MKKVVLFCFMWLVAYSSQAQLQVPASSPSSTLIQKVGLSDVKIEYSRPSAKGRTVFGGLVPFGEMWRTGANASTKITFSDDVMVNEVPLAKGTYALYTIPNERSWEVVLHKNTTHWGTGGKEYKKEEDALRFSVSPTEVNPSVETFTISIGNITNSSADISLAWENTQVTFNVSVDTDSKVMASIKKQLSGPSDRTYYQAARYYHETKRDLGQALEWINMSMELDKPTYWKMRLRALIEADLGNYKQAIKSAQKSTEMAKEAGNMDYVRMNEKSIKEWESKR